MPLGARRSRRNSSVLMKMNSTAMVTCTSVGALCRPLPTSWMSFEAASNEVKLDVTARAIPRKGGVPAARNNATARTSTDTMPTATRGHVR
jgi:hypothetical protein